MTQGGIELLKYRPEVAPWQFRSHRLRRLHRKLCQVDGRVAFVGGINVIDDMVQAAAGYPLIREFTTTPSHYVEVQPTGQLLGFNNTNSLVKSGGWDIQVSKTGFIREAGKCLVMMATIASRQVVIVLLDSYGRLTRIGDANRVKHWLETGQALPATASAKPSAKSKRAKVIPARA